MVLEVSRWLLVVPVLMCCDRCDRVSHLAPLTGAGATLSQSVVFVMMEVVAVL